MTPAYHVPATVALVALLAFTGHARAQQGGVHLRWDAPAGCPARAVVLRAVRAQVEGPLDERRAIEVDAHVASTTNGFVLRLLLRDGEHTVEREIEAVRCATLADSAALLIALAYGDALAETRDAGAEGSTAATRGPPTAQQREAAEPRPDKGPSPAPPETAPPPVRQPPRERDDAREWDDGAPGARVQGLLALGPVLDFGLLPDAALGLRGFGELGVGDLRFALALSLWPEQSRQLAAPASAGARAQLTAIRLGARACFEATRGQLAAGPCLALDGGMLSAETLGVARPATRRGQYLGVGGGLYLRIPLLGNLLVAFDGALLSSLGRPHFLLRSGDRDVAVHTVAAVDITVWAGIAWVL